MGALYSFTCASCGYQANVSGGADTGFIIKTQTGVCRICDQLVDYVVEVWAEDDETEKEVSIGRCRKCNTPVTENWNRGDACPRCDGQFHQPVFYMDWD